MEMPNFENINSEDVNVIKDFIKHFDLPVSDSLNKAMDNLSIADSKENKDAFGKELLDYFATNPKADLTLLDELFKPVQEEIVKANTQLKGE